MSRGARLGFQRVFTKVLSCGKPQIATEHKLFVIGARCIEKSSCSFLIQPTIIEWRYEKRTNPASFGPPRASSVFLTARASNFAVLRMAMG